MPRKSSMSRRYLKMTEGKNFAGIQGLSEPWPQKLMMMRRKVANSS